MKRNLRSARIAAAFLTAALITTACSTNGGNGGQATHVGDPIRLGDQSWESLWINNGTVAFILEHGYGRDTEIVSTSMPVMQQAIVQDEIDVVVEMYPQNVAEWWNQVRDDGTVTDLGQIMETTRRGLYVPRYVVEGDAERGIEPVAPDLRHVEDLPQYAHLFPDPEDGDMGQIVSCIIGWACIDAVSTKAAVYGLDEHFNLLEPGSSAAMDTAIASAYRAGEPVVFYYWEPTWLVSDFDLILLEMDEWTEECEAATVAAVEAGEEPTDAARCAFPQPAVHIAASTPFVERDPEIAEFLTQMFLGIDRVGELTSWMQANEGEPDDVALHYLDTHRDEWRQWLPDDVADRVEVAVDAAV